MNTSSRVGRSLGPSAVRVLTLVAGGRDFRLSPQGGSTAMMRGAATQPEEG